jgi:hypothetical protein
VKLDDLLVGYFGIIEKIIIIKKEKKRKEKKW